MAQKNATPSKKLQEIIRKNNLNPALYVVMKELDHSIVITGSPAMLRSWTSRGGSHGR